MLLFTRLGDKGLIWIIICLILLARKKTRKSGILTSISLIFCSVLGILIFKNIFNRPRPFVDIQGLRLVIDESGSFSFPSGHSLSAFSAATMITISYKTLDKRLKFLLWFTAVTIALSRLYFMVHYPSDIICGALFGSVSSIIIYKIYEKTAAAND